MEPNNSHREDDLEMALLKKDVSQITMLFEKLDTTIAGIQELTMTITKMLAVHENRIDSSEEEQKDIRNVVELRRMETKKEFQEVNKKIDDMGEKISKSLSDKLDSHNDNVMNAIRELKNEVDESEKTHMEENKELKKRLDNIERWKLLIIGGSVVAVIFVNLIIEKVFG